ncbi:RAN binding protein 1 [Rhynchospora pubera]|uniref:RAN binding protein 1 n=1 Tax=Rhynchospora pubera TaxID=906938 RepID=A0AAV8FQC2_9POAL|nr:RAN binding protein 1 [Rhynchospora pubera]KAJ4816916.1 RAN binding protein 1 [Rhynchospora pubera]
MASTEPEKKVQEEEENTTAAATGEEEDTGAEFAPIVRLEEVAVTTGEEDEDALLDLKAKLYRYDKEGSQWKERGTGNVKLLKHKESGKVRLVMRQNKTLKICANHLVTAATKMQEHVGNEKSCVWHATDFSDGELKDEMFCIRFASIENCRTFKDKVEEIAESVRKSDTKEEDKDASDAAGLLDNLTVSEKKTEATPSKEEASSPST